jgi:hypothetical protein
MLDTWLKEVVAAIDNDPQCQACVQDFLQVEDVSDEDEDAGLDSEVIAEKNAAIAKLQAENEVFLAQSRTKDKALAIALRKLKLTEERLKACRTPKSISQQIATERPQITMKIASPSDMSTEEFAEVQKMPRGLKMAILCEGLVNSSSAG